MKLIAIDIGNTSIHAAAHNGRKWTSEYRLATKSSKKDRKVFLKKILRAHPGYCVSIASVVPKLGREIREYLERKSDRRVQLIGVDRKVPIKNLYRNPAQVGVDRLLNAYAAYRRFKREMIIIDFGTAITFDVVSKKGEYLGGVISPGIELSLDALFERTALLPKIKLAHPRESVGRDTVESIRIGCSVGIGGLCDRVVETIKKTHQMTPLVLATGGYAPFMKKYCRSIDRVSQKLILEAIREISLTK